METISVVIPTYNRANLICNAIDSALKQTCPPTEIIVVDDGSTDETEEILSQYAEKIRYFRQKNMGISNARNRGIRECRGDLVAFLDSDDIWLPEKLSKQIEFLKMHPSVGLVHTDAFYQTGATGERKTLSHPRFRYIGNCDNELFIANAIATPSVLVRRNCFELTGVFDETIIGGRVEDRDMWLRIAKEFEFGYLPEPLVVVRVHDTNVSNDGGLMAESLVHVLRKNLRANQKLREKVGRRRVRKAVHNAAFDAAHAKFERGELRSARRYFKIALMNEPNSLITWGLYTSSFLPEKLRSILRVVKQHFS